jgi:hypothetical protein
MPEQGLLTSVEFHVAGLDYIDPVYGYQHESGYARAAVWDASDGSIVTQSGYQALPPASGGTQPYVSFDLDNVTVSAGTSLIVGFWRRSDSTAYSTQWDYCEDGAAVGYTTYSQSIYGSDTGPHPFKTTTVHPDRALNFKLHYTNGGRIQVWDGNVWRPKPIYVFDGSNWVKGTVSVWDGTAWIEATE